MNGLEHGKSAAAGDDGAAKPAVAPEPSTASAEGREQGFQRHLRRASELIGARRLPEGEVEILKALALSANDLRALKLLALVRFKLGRLAEARAVYRTAREVAPEDAAVRLNLGLIALKLDWFEEAITELESTTRLAPSDARAWSYLGYAYARTGASHRAAAAFRRAGQPEIAVEVEGGKRPASEPLVALLGGADPSSSFESPRSDPAPAAPAPVEPSSATGFAFAHLVAADRAEGDTSRGDGVLRFLVDGEAHARQSALLAASGEVRVEPAKSRQRGRLTDAVLGADDPFVRCLGDGDLWLTIPPQGQGLVALSLDQDVLYLREARVVAFDGDVVWESGCVPWDGLPLLQFRGSGRVVVDAGRGELVALRVPEGQPITVARSRLVGWLGRVVAQSVREADRSGSLPRIACEGEGVLLLSKHGDATQSVHERSQPGDHGPSPVGPGRSRLHR